jgi:thiamine biosynthesis lipoprotein
MGRAATGVTRRLVAPSLAEKSSAIHSPRPALLAARQLASAPPRAVLGVRLLLLLLLLALAGCSKPPPLHHQESYVFGTRVEVLVFGEREGKARSAAAAVLLEFDRLHHMLHAWQTSDLTRLNDAIARGEAATVTPELAALLTDAQAIAALGDQLFNPAIGRLIALWGFHSDEFKPQLPPQDQLDELIEAAPTMADLRIEGERISSRKSELALDLGGYAKGYALDRAAVILRGRGVNNALINIGGNVLALGSKDGQPWRVGIQHPRAPTALAYLPLHDGEAIGTSGDYQRYFELDGKRYCHLLDPRSGRPATAAQAVTVLVTPRERTGALSDAASKPLFIAAEADWRRLAGQLGVQHVLRVDAGGQMVATRALAERLELAPSIKIDRLVD